MTRWMQRQLLEWMRVPKEPQPPDGSAGSIHVFRAGRNYYRWRLAVWLAANIGVAVLVAILLFVISLAIRHAPPFGRVAGEAAGVLLVMGLLISALCTFLQQRLNYELRWYLVTDRCLRVRSGIMNVHEITTTFGNIQEVRLSSGPLQKLLGLADVEVHSAGGGSGRSSSGHIARFEGVENAPEIRDFILARLRQYRDSGLGGKDATHPVESEEGTVAAARAVLAEARSLRESFSKGPGDKESRARANDQSGTPRVIS
jgi:membrane protein YdbS with pleckstrin-like domain